MIYRNFENFNLCSSKESLKSYYRECLRKTITFGSRNPWILFIPIASEYAGLLFKGAPKLRFLIPINLQVFFNKISRTQEIFLISKPAFIFKKDLNKPFNKTFWCLSTFQLPQANRHFNLKLSDISSDYHDRDHSRLWISLLGRKFVDEHSAVCAINRKFGALLYFRHITRSKRCLRTSVADLLLQNHTVSYCDSLWYNISYAFGIIN